MVWTIGLLISGALFALMSIGMLLKRRIFLAGINGVTGLGLLSFSATALLIFLNIHTYSQLTGELELAKVSVGKTGDKGTFITLLQSGNQYSFIIEGDEWQLDARFLKWKPWASLLGKEPVVRLERLSGRNSKAVISGAQTAYTLFDQESIINRMGSTLSDWIGIVDTYYGSSVYMPVAEGSVYVVTASVSGLVARPDNIHAVRAVKSWMSP